MDIQLTLLFVLVGCFTYGQAAEILASGRDVDVRIRELNIKRSCSVSDSPGFLALYLMKSVMKKKAMKNKLSVERIESAYAKKESPPMNKYIKDMAKYKDIVFDDMCNYEDCYHGRCHLKPACQRERDVMKQGVFTCAEEIMKPVFGDVSPFMMDRHLRMFFNLSIVLSRTYYWSGHQKNVRFNGDGNTFLDLFVRLVAEIYRLYIEDSTFPVSLDTKDNNVRNKIAALKCVLKAKGEDPNDISKYESNGFADITNDFVEDVFFALLTSTIAEDHLKENERNKIKLQKSATGKIHSWKLIGKRIKLDKKQPFCVHPVDFKFAELQATCKLANMNLQDPTTTKLAEDVNKLIDSSKDQTPDKSEDLIPTTTFSPAPTMFAMTFAQKVQPAPAVVASFPGPPQQPINSDKGPPAVIPNSYGPPQIALKSSYEEPKVAGFSMKSYNEEPKVAAFVARPPPQQAISGRNAPPSMDISNGRSGPMSSNINGPYFPGK